MPALRGRREPREVRMYTRIAIFRCSILDNGKNKFGQQDQRHNRNLHAGEKNQDPDCGRGFSNMLQFCQSQKPVAETR
jgi:hypothetical protein